MMDKVTLRCSALRGYLKNTTWEDGPTNGQGDFLATYAYHLRQEVGYEAIHWQAKLAPVMG